MRQIEHRRNVSDAFLALLPGALVVYLALRGGGYDSLIQQEAAIAVWYAVFLGLALKFFPRESQHRSTWVTALAIASFAGWITLSLFWTDSPDATVRELDLALLYLGIFALAVLAQSRHSLNWWIGSLAAGIAAVTALATLSRMVPGPFPNDKVSEFLPDATARLSYPFGYWNGLAFLVACNVPLLLHMSATAKRRWTSALAVAALPLSGLALYMTFSRGATAGAALGACLYVGFSPRRQKALLPLAIGAAGMLILALRVRFSPELADGLTATSDARTQGWILLVVTIAVCAAAAFAWLRLEHTHARIPAVPRLTGSRGRMGVAVAIGVSLLVLLTAGGAVAIGNGWDRFKNPEVAYSSEPGAVSGRLTSASSHGRVQFWETSVDAFKENPIAGSGAGTWEFWWARIGTLDDFVRNSHSLYFDALPELGVVGVALLLLLMGYPFRVAYRRYRRTDSRDTRAAIAALAAVAVVFSLSTVIDWTWKLSGVGAVYFLALGLLVGPALAPEADPRAGLAERHRAPTYGAGVAVIAVAWIAMLACAIPMLGERKVRESQEYVRKLDYTKALASAKTAGKLEPWAARPKVQAALVHQLALQPTLAVDAARAAVKIEPVNWRNWQVLADIEQWAKQPSNYDQSIRQALALNPRSKMLRQRVDALATSKNGQ